MERKAIIYFVISMLVIYQEAYAQSGPVYTDADYVKACILTCHSHFNDGCAVVRYYGALAYINDQGKEIMRSDRNIMFNDQDYSEGLKSMSDSEEWKDDLSFGFVDKQGKYVIQPFYDNPSIFSEGLAYVKSVPFTGFINQKDERVIELKEEYSEVRPFKDGMAAVKKNEKWGFINKQGIVSVPIVYDNVCDFSEGLAAVEQNGKCGFVDKSGRVVIPTKYEPVSADIKFQNGYAEVFENGYKSNMFNLSFESRKEFDGYAMYIDPSSILTKGYNLYKRIIDKNGNEIKDAKSISGLDGVYTYVKDINISPDKSMSFGLKSLNGNVILPPTYGYIGEFNNGLALVFNNNKAGYIDKQGNIKIQCKYDDGNVFSEGIAAVKKGGKWGYINTQGREITPFIFKEARPCKGGFACVGVGDKYGFISKSGAPLIIELSGHTEFMAGRDEDRFWKPEDSSTNKYIDKAISFYKKGADKGDINSCFKLGYYSFIGAGAIKKDYAEAVKWFTKCQNGKDRTSGVDFLYLGYCYAEGGFGITKDEVKAFQYFQKGAELGNDDCNNSLIYCYLKGLGCTKNIQEACKLVDIQYKRKFNYEKTQYLGWYFDCYNTLAYEYANKGNNTQAFATIDKLISTVSELLKDYEKSIEGFNKNDAVVKRMMELIDKIKYALGNAYDSKGEFYLMKGDTNEAISMWKKVMEYDGKNLDFYKQHSELYKQLKAKGII